MNRLAACLVAAALLPACITDPADLESGEVEQELGRTPETTLVLTTGSNQISSYGLTATLRVRLVTSAGWPMVGMSVKALVGTTPYYATTDADGVATIRNNFVALGPPKQHAVTWSFAGGGGYGPSTASSTFTVIRTDCRVSVRSTYDPATNKQQVFATLEGRGDSSVFRGIVGKPLELMNNSTTLGVPTTQAGHVVPHSVHPDGHVDLAFTPTGNTGTLWASFDGDAYYGPCGDSYAYVNVLPFGEVSVSSNTTSATIGTTNLNLTIRTRELDGGILTARPYTKVRVYSEQPTDGDWFDPMTNYLGEVTTSSTGLATLTVPITNVVGKKAFVANLIRFYGRTDAPINYEALSSQHYVTPVQVGEVRITNTLVSSIPGAYTVRWTARNAATNATIAGIELDGPCANMVTDSLGTYTCTLDDQWHTWATVARTTAWVKVP